MSRKRVQICTGLLAAVSVVAGCASTADSNGSETEAVHAALVEIPAGIQCVQVIAATASATTRKTFTVTPGPAMSLDMGRLPIGSTTFTANAFDVACATLGASSVASWIGGPTTVLLEYGVVSPITLRLRPNDVRNVVVDFQKVPIALALESLRTYALLADGTVWAWGKGFFGTGSVLPSQIPSLSGVVEMAAGHSHTCFRMGDGTVKCMGLNGNGQLGDGTTTSRTVPTSVPGLTDAIGVSAGDHHSCAIRGSGAPVCWGNNVFGQLGDNTTIERNLPTPVNDSIPFVAVQLCGGSAHTCARDNTGRILCWGDNSLGQLGRGSNVGQPRPQPADFRAAIDVACGYSHTCAVRANGSLWCVGENGFGQLGNGTTTGQIFSVKIIDSGVKAVTATRTGACMRTASTVSCWGRGQLGQVGDGSGDNKLTPTTPLGLTGASLIAGGPAAESMCAVSAGETFCWGSNSHGQLGDGAQNGNRFTPTLVKW